MQLPVRLALRYIFKRRSSTLVHIISGISVAVIAAVAAAMICILSAFNGIEDLVKELFGTLDADVAVMPAKGATLPEAWGEVLSDVPGVAHWAPVLEDECVVRAEEAVRVATVMGVDSLYKGVARIERSIYEGAYLVDKANEGFRCACLGLGVRTELEIRSDSVQAPMFSMSAPIRGRKLARHREHSFRTLPVHACGTFSINADLDTRYVLAPLDLVQELMGREQEVSRFEVRAREGWSQDELAVSINATYATRMAETSHQIKTLTRDDKHRFITQTNQAEKWATFAILSFILVVAAFNIMASLTMLLLDKKQDLEVLRALGMPIAMMERAFGLQGLVINAAGGLFGVAIGTLLVSGQARFGWLKLEGSVVPSYPVRLDTLDVLGTLGIVIVIGGIGSSAMVRHLIRRQTNT